MDAHGGWSRDQEFLRFLKLIDGAVPRDPELHLVLDNYATTRPAIKDLLLKHPVPPALHPGQLVRVTAICAVVTAVLSLSVSIIEVRAAREHNRQSVRPLLQFVRKHDHGHPWAGLVLENVGLGPAIFTGSTVRLDGQASGTGITEPLT